MMRFYCEQRRFYCGIDLHASKMYVCVLDDQGNVVLHRNMRAEPEPLKRALAPYRASLVVGAECMFSWYWLADWCREEGIEFVLGHALYMREGQERPHRLGEDRPAPPGRHVSAGARVSQGDAGHTRPAAAA
jgi:hypothetical protein